MFPPKKKPAQGNASNDESGIRDRPDKGGKPNPFGKPGQQAQDDGWKDGEPFDPKAFKQEHGDASKRAKGDEAGGFGGKPHAIDEDGDGKHDGDDWKDGEPFDPKAAAEGGPNGAADEAKPAGMHVEPHESGAGHKIHFHDEVQADLPADGDYQHHVMEHAKHYAGYLTHKDVDSQKAEAHRQAANLHARVGNALHAGGDTSPRRASSGAGGGFGPPGGPNGGPEGSKTSQVGPDGERLSSGGDFGDFGQPSPGDDAAGGGHPAVPDAKRNLPGRDSLIEADRARSGKQFPPLPLMGKSLRKGGPYIGPRGGKWADPEHTIPWHAPGELPGMREANHLEMEDRKKPYKVNVTSYSRYRAPGGETRTTFLIEDPRIPEPRFHKYEGRGKTPMERRSHALKQHAEKFGIKQHVTHADLKKRAAKQARRGVESSLPGSKTIKLATRDGFAEQPVHAEHGQWAAHKGFSEGYTVSHRPTGLAVKHGMSKDEAAALALHMHTQMGDSFKDIEFGESPERRHPDMPRVAEAMKKWSAMGAPTKKSLKLTLSKALFDYTW